MDKLLYQKQISSYNLQQCEKIFNILNNKLFQNEIKGQIRYNNRRHSLNALGVNRSIIFSDDRRYAIEVPERLIYQNDESVLTWILTQMIAIYGIIHEINSDSNRGVFKNKRFKRLADKYGLLTARGKYGWEPIGCANSVKQMVCNIKFEQIPVYSETKDGTKKSSSRTYSDGKTKIRACRPNHIIYCITDYPIETQQRVIAFMNKLNIPQMEIIK